MNNNKSEIERLKKLIKKHEEYVKEFETIKGNQFTPIIYMQNLNRLDEMRRTLDVYLNEKRPSEDSLNQK
jgi:hypothetical protein